MNRESIMHNSLDQKDGIWLEIETNKGEDHYHEGVKLTCSYRGLLSIADFNHIRAHPSDTSFVKLERVYWIDGSAWNGKEFCITPVRFGHETLYRNFNGPLLLRINQIVAMAPIDGKKDMEWMESSISDRKVVTPMNDTTMDSMIQMFEKKYIGEAEINPFLVCKILGDAGMDANIKDDNIVIVTGRRFDVVITVATEGVFKLFYSATVSYRPRLPLLDRLIAANRINQAVVGGAQVKGDSVRIASTLSFEGGILAHNIVNTIRAFQAVVEGTLETEEGNGLLE